MARLLLYGLILLGIMLAIVAAQRAITEPRRGRPRELPYPTDAPTDRPLPPADLGTAPGDLGTPRADRGTSAGAGETPPGGPGETRLGGAPDPWADAAPPPPPPGLAAGWYPDTAPGRERWWDGTAWTDLYR